MLELIRADAALLSAADLGVEGSVLARLGLGETPTVPTLIVGTGAFAESQKTHSLPADVDASLTRFAALELGGVLAVRASTPQKLLGLPKEAQAAADPDRLRYLIDRIYRSWDDRRAKAYRITHRLSDADTRPAIIVQALAPGDVFALSTRDARDGDPTTAANYARSAVNRVEWFSDGYRDMLRAVESVTRRPTTVLFQDQGRRVRSAPRVVGVKEQNITSAGMIRFLRSLHSTRKLDTLEVLLLLEPATVGGAVGLPSWVKDEDAVAAIPAVNGVAVGRVVWRGLRGADTRHRSCIFLTETFYPDDLDMLRNCTGAISTEGGRASHLALACRGMQKPAVVGAQTVTMDRPAGSIQVGGLRFAGEFYALVDGSAGKVMFSEERPTPVPVMTYEARVAQGDLEWIEALAAEVLDTEHFVTLPAAAQKRIIDLTQLVDKLRCGHA